MVRNIFLFLLFAFSTGIMGCSRSPDIQRSDELPDRRNQKFEDMGKLFGDDALKFGGDRSDPERTTGIGVNSFLWRASLDTISFIPLQSADPFGGLIITEWYSPQDNPRERVKVHILILGQVLRTDALRVKIHKQIKESPGGDWHDVDSSGETVVELENTILTRARQLRVSAEN